MKTLVKNSIPSILDELFNDRFVNNQWLSQAPQNRFSKAAFNVKENESFYVMSCPKIDLQKNLAKHAKNSQSTPSFKSLYLHSLVLAKHAKNSQSTPSFKSLCCSLCEILLL